MKNGSKQVWNFCKIWQILKLMSSNIPNIFLKNVPIYLPEHFKGRIEVNLCPWYWNGSMHIGSLDEAALRLTLVVLCNQRINQFKRQSQTCKKQSI